MNPQDPLETAARALPVPDLSPKTRDRILRKAHRILDRQRETPAWLRGLGLAWGQTEPMLVAATALLYLGWAVAVIRNLG